MPKNIFSIDKLGIPSIVLNYCAGQIVSDCPDGIPSVGLIQSGRVDVYAASLDGREVQLNSLGNGEHFGISNLLADAELQTVLRCSEDSKILYVGKAALTEAIMSDSELALAYAVHCNRKLQFLLKRIEFLTMQTCRGKVIAYLLSHKDSEGKVVLYKARETLANHLGISRAALFRELSFLQSKKLIHSKDNILYIDNICELEDILYH